MNTTRLAVPSETVWIGESYATGTNDTRLSFSLQNAATTPPFPQNTCGGVPQLQDSNGSCSGGWTAKHLNTTNVLWCDGHVKAMNLDKLNDGSDSVALYGSVASAAKVARLFTVQAD